MGMRMGAWKEEFVNLVQLGSSVDLGSRLVHLDGVGALLPGCHFLPPQPCWPRAGASS